VFRSGVPDMWRRHNPVFFNAQAEGLAEQLRFTIDRRLRFLIDLETPIDVVAHKLRGDVDSAHAPKGFPNRLQV
jgi:hypothetical protein